MTFAKFSAAVCSLFSLIAYVQAVAIAVTPRDTVSPPILLPNFDTVWTVGQQAIVTWYVRLNLLD